MTDNDPCIISDLENGEALISAKAATRKPPFFVDGKSCHISSVYRAFSPGWKPDGGGERVTLEYVMANGGRATTLSALSRFMGRMGGIGVKPRQSDDHRRAQRELANEGL